MKNTQNSNKKIREGKTNLILGQLDGLALGLAGLGLGHQLVGALVVDLGILKV